jgi:hypothetical protein
MSKQNLLTHWIIPILLIVVVSVLYFFPYYQGYRFRAADQIQVEYMYYPLHEIKVQTGRYPLWTPHLFSGMPTYLISYQGENVFWKAPTYYLTPILREYPPLILLAGLLGFFLFLWAEGLQGPLALAGAFAFVMMSYYTNMIVATHWGKSSVLFTAPYGLAGMSLIFKGRWAAGIVLSLLGWAGMIGGHHPQMLYYVLSLWVAYGLYRLWEAWKSRAWKPFLGLSALLFVSAAVGALSQAANILPYYEYGKYSIRGGSELERDRERDPALQSGLDKAYAQSYSATRAEIWSLIIPDIVGGTSQEDLLKRLGRSSALYQAFQQYGIQNTSFLRAVPTYWGGSPFSAGSFYAGIIPFFLIILGLMYKADALDWILLYTGWIILQLSLGSYGYSLWATPLLLALPWLSYALPRRYLSSAWRPWAATALFLIGWGAISLLDNTPEESYKLTDAALEYLPFYNKFRAPSTLLVVMGFLWGWMGMRGLKRFLDEPSAKRLWVSLGIVASVIILVGVFGSWWFSFEGASDQELRNQNLPEWFFEALREDRITLAQRSAIQVLFWLALSGGILTLAVRNLLKATAASFALAILILLDGWLVNSRYFPRQSTYVRKTEISMPPPPQPYETFLKQQDTTFYRILPLHTSPFTDARPGVFLENAGGYHPAKLKRYQQLIETHLSRLSPQTLQMLHAKYLTTSGQPLPAQDFDSLITFPDGITLYRLRAPLRYAWLAESLVVYPRVDQTLDSLSQYDLTRYALLTQKDLQSLPLQPQNAPLDSTENVQVLKRRPTEEIVLQVRTRLPRLLVLSEVHYPPDWKAQIDDQEAPIIYANFILRGVAVPPGEHTVRFYLQSSVHERGAWLSLIGSIMAWGLVGLIFVRALWQWHKWRQAKNPS